MSHRFFHPPRLPGAPPLDRGAGPNSGPDCRESVGWNIRLPLPSSGFFGNAPLGRKGRDSGPCISSRWGLWTLELPPALPVCRPSPPESAVEVRRPPPLCFEYLLAFATASGRFAASPYFFVPA